MNRAAKLYAPLTLALVAILAAQPAGAQLKQSRSTARTGSAVAVVTTAGKANPSDTSSEVQAVTLVDQTGAAVSPTGGTTGCTAKAAAPTYVEASTGNALSCDLSGNLRTSGGSGGGAVTNAGTFAVQNTAATPAGSNIIGNVRIDQTTAGTTNGVVVNSSALPTGAATAALQTTENTALGTTGSTACASSASTCDMIAVLKGILGATQGTGPTTTGNLSATLAMTTATTTKIITGVSAKLTYVTAFSMSSSAAATVSFVSGTGSNCGTGTATLWQTDFVAGAGATQGVGIGNLISGVAASTDVCMTVSATSNVKTNVSYVQQ